MKDGKLNIVMLVLILLVSLFNVNIDSRVRETEKYNCNNPVVSMERVNVATACLESAVFIECPSGGYTGSGVIIGPNMITTARHVAQNGDLIITDKYGIIYESVSVKLHPDSDCAIVEVDGDFNSYAILAGNCSVEVTDEILAIGSPYGFNYFNTVKFGKITGLDRIISTFGDLPVNTCDAHGDPGMSGCGIFNMDGEVIGVLVGTYSYFGNATVYVPVRYIKELLCGDMENEQKVENSSQPSCAK